MSHLGPLKCQESSDRVCSTPRILELGAIHLSVLLAVDHSGAAVRAASAEGPRCPRAPRPAQPRRCRAGVGSAGGPREALSAMLSVRHVGLPQGGGGAGLGEAVRRRTVCSPCCLFTCIV